jgi:hypothetical protein
MGRVRRRVPWCDAMAVRVSCRALYLYSNQLSGSIPSTLGSLTALRSVSRGGRVRDWVRFSVGSVWGGRTCVPCCVLRARGGVHAVMIAQCAVVGAV